jgi:flagellar assembly protein FliH
MKVIDSIKDYIASEYKEQGWERLGVCAGVDFNALDCEKLELMPSVNPMFEDFEESRFSEVEAVAEGNADLEINSELLEKIRNESFAEGKAVGFEEGNNQAAAEYNERLKELENQFSQLTLEIEQGKNKFCENLEKEALNLALQVAKRILQITAEAKPEYIVEILHRAFETNLASRPLKIKMSRADYEFVKKVGLPEELNSEKTGVKYEADNNIKSGCIVETEAGNVDLQLESMWREVVAQLEEIYK